MSVSEIPTLTQIPTMNGSLRPDTVITPPFSTVLNSIDTDKTTKIVGVFTSEEAPAPKSLEKKIQIRDLFSTIEDGITASEKQDYEFIKAQIAVSLKKEGLGASQTLTSAQFSRVYDRVGRFLRENDRTFSWYGQKPRILTNIKISMGIEQSAMTIGDLVDNIQPAVNFINQARKYQSICSASDNWLEDQVTLIVTTTERLGQEVDSLKRKIKLAIHNGNNSEVTALQICLKEVEEAYAKGQVVQGNMILKDDILSTADTLIMPVETPDSQPPQPSVQNVDSLATLDNGIGTSGTNLNPSPVDTGTQTTVLPVTASISTDTDNIEPEPMVNSVEEQNKARLAAQVGGVRRRLRSVESRSRTMTLDNGRNLVVDPLPEANLVSEPNSLEKLNTSLENWFRNNGKLLRRRLVVFGLATSILATIYSYSDQFYTGSKEVYAGSFALIANPTYVGTMDISGLRIEKTETGYAYYSGVKQLGDEEAAEIFPNIDTYVDEALANYPSLFKGSDEAILRARIKQVMIAYAKTSSQCELATTGQMRPQIRNGSLLAPEVLNPNLSLQTMVAVGMYDSATNCSLR